jgi:phage-related protein
MKFFEETTEWKHTTPNHTYLLSDDKSKLFAYVRVGSNKVHTFKTPIRFDTKGRKFVAVKNGWGYNIDKPADANPRWEVAGSKGDVYVVEQTENGLTCSCSGFRFRGACKHVKEIEAKL